MKLSVERAMEILDPTHRERYSDLSDGLEQINEAMRMGRRALSIVHCCDCKQCEDCRKDLRK